MTILELIQKTSPFLEKAGVPNPRLDVELLLAHVLQLKRMQLYVQFERVLTEQELAELRPLVKRRAAREPLQHIVGSVDFCGLELLVGPQALIPRPETEMLVETLIETIGKQTSAKILDLCTGTGAIALALLHLCKNYQCIATDLYEKPLVLARANAEKHQLMSRIEFRHGDLFKALRTDEKFDMIVSNPPYIPTHEIATLQPEVKFDPIQALEGGTDGLKIIREIISGAKEFLMKEGWLMFEMGHDQSDQVIQLLKAEGYINISVINDLQNIPRIARARKSG
jgi:release factor glutamine methyltransferase